MRWQYGGGYRNQTRFYEDILRIGWDNMTHEILEEVATKKEATERENYYISLYRSNEPEYGYNKNSDKTYQAKLYRYVHCVTTGEVFESAVAAGEKYGVTGSAIGYAIKNNTYCAGRKWEKVEMTRDEYQYIVKN